MIRVKICGITNADDALWAVDSGADAIGLIFAESSPRRVSEEQAAAIRKQLPPFVCAVGVFVDPDPINAMRTYDRVGLDLFQLQKGDESTFLSESGLNPQKLIRAISIGTEADLAEAENTSAAAILLDTKVEGIPGGTGKTFDWSIAAKAGKYGKPIILAGGLNPENVGTAIESVSPQAVDVCSGVESSPGKKDPDKVREFIRRAKSYAT